MALFIGILIGLAAGSCCESSLWASIPWTRTSARSRLDSDAPCASQATKLRFDDPIAEALRPEERTRYAYPQVRVIQPGGPYFRMPWEKIHKVSSPP